jgi:hypothetical protein
MKSSYICSTRNYSQFSISLAPSHRSKAATMSQEPQEEIKSEIIAYTGSCADQSTEFYISMQAMSSTR